MPGPCGKGAPAPLVPRSLSRFPMSGARRKHLPQLQRPPHAPQRPGRSTWRAAAGEGLAKALPAEGLPRFWARPRVPVFAGFGCQNQRCSCRRHSLQHLPPATALHRRGCGTGLLPGGTHNGNNLLCVAGNRCGHPAR